MRGSNKRLQIKVELLGNDGLRACKLTETNDSGSRTGCRNPLKKHVTIRPLPVSLALGFYPGARQGGFSVRHASISLFITESKRRRETRICIAKVGLGLRREMVVAGWCMSQPGTTTARRLHGQSTDAAPASNHQRATGTQQLHAAL